MNKIVVPVVKLNCCPNKIVPFLIIFVLSKMKMKKKLKVRIEKYFQCCLLPFDKKCMD